ncbi:MAG: protein tyrosine phosphatase [Ancylobacter novellus]|uniref:Protein tyrosine phosphatase n=1 Tax=Ancylobacter novellus TaxID=921 RepID=A0A2W5SNF9_ANCNO|nr:MAG: protein tyrosine phosphatase [Ancylobacter novellus]
MVRGGVVRRWARRTGLLALVGLAAAGVYAGWAYANGNLHTVVEGELYRSATLPAEQLRDLIASRGIRTIINLRGPSEDAHWYREEAKIAEEHGVRLVDLTWSARRELTDEQVKTYLATLADAPRPILVHCRSGVDRTGLASAIYLAVVKKADEFTAETQLSLLFGHISLPFLPFYAMDETFERLEPSLGYPNS